MIIVGKIPRDPVLKQFINPQQLYLHYQDIVDSINQDVIFINPRDQLLPAAILQVPDQPPDLIE